MSDILLKAYKASEIKFVNTCENGQQISFSNKYGYSVKYSDNNICIGELSAEMFDKDNPENFGIKVVINGIFEFNPAIKKEQIHILSFKELFPFAKSIVSAVSVNAGVPQIMLPSFDIEKQSIYKFEKNI